MATARHESHVVLDRHKLMRELRRRGHSAASFAPLARVSATTLSGVLHSSKPITPRTARRIAETLQRIPAIDGLDGIMQVEED
jgi:lambda repressor-like predicted transcriptional regulator